ncbi:hypothetical protein FOXYSP1_11993 [Fusarium oxysporum f. sp. phaseoli]
MASPTATLDALTQHYHGNPSRSDKIAIIGLTYLAHRQQKKEQRKEVQERATRAARLNLAADRGMLPHKSQAPISSTATMTNTIHRRMSDRSVIIAIAISCTAVVVIFLAAVLFCSWRSRPKSPTGTRGREHDDSDANSDIELDAMPDGALNHPLVRGSNGAGHVYPVFELPRERHAHAQN